MPFGSSDREDTTMDTTRFDQLSTSLARTRGRRDMVRLLGVAVLGGAGLHLLHADESEARKRHKKKGDGKGNGGTGDVLPSGALCDNDNQCATSQNHRICEVPQNASNSDKRCCGASGAVCGGVNEDGDAQPPFCCIGEAGRRSFVCSENDPERPNVRGTCLPAPEDD
jgi:hypothetical protein